MECPDCHSTKYITYYVDYIARERHFLSEKGDEVEWIDRLDGTEAISSYFKCENCGHEFGAETYIDIPGR